MGIKFYCPNGHKLNVKSFLAGKRGVCPHCDARVDIPLESQIPSSKNRVAEGVPQGVFGDGNGSSERATPGLATPDLDAGHAPSHPGSGAALDEAQGNGAVSAAHNGAPIAFPHVPTDGTAPVAMATSPLAAAEASQAAPQSALPAASAVSTGAPVATSAAPHGVPHAVPGGVPTAIPASPGGHPSADPIAESIHAVWYVRPSSGGQFGPAKGDIMRRWMTEGRVASDSLVWREDWADWRSAVEVFPELRDASDASAPHPPAGASSPAADVTGGPVGEFGGSVTTGGPTSGTTSGTTSGATESQSAGRRGAKAPRRRASNTGIILVILLGMLSVGLLVTLFILLSGQS